MSATSPLPPSSSSFSSPFSARRAARAGAVVAALVLLGARPAAAQIADPEARATRGVYIAGGARAGDADASGVQLNPGQLGLLRASSLQLTAGIWGQSVPLPGRGVGLLWAAPIFSHTAIGIGLQRVGASPAVGVDAHTLFQLAYAARFGRKLSIGASWTHVWDSLFAGTDTFDIGLGLQASRYLALGLVVEDVGSPTPEVPLLPVELPRLWAGELALRPLGTSTVEVALGAAHVEDDRWRRVAPRARIAATLIDGLRLYATGESLPRGRQYALSDGADYRVSFGMTVDFDHVGATAGSHATPNDTDAGVGAGLVLRVDGDRRPSLIAAPTVVARVSVEGIDTDREFVELVRRLRVLEAEPRVAGVLLKIEQLELGLGRIEELRERVASLRARGKRVYAYAPFPSTRAYYLAVACDGVIVHPAGEVSLSGFAQTVTFYKRAMDRLGVNLDLVRIAEFKGAMEPFIMTEQSAPVRQNRNELLDDTFGRLVAAIVAGRRAEGRALDEARVRALVDRGLFTPLEAQMAGLIDAVKDEGEIEAWLRQETRQPSLSVRDPDPAPLHPQSWPSRRVAVVLVDGAITDGGSRRLPFDMGTFAGSDTLGEALQECARDASIGAVVLRVNSPGGSAFASDVIARAVQDVKKAGKPVVVSMGDSATSGGYYISAPADVIYSQPSTITGSIGIFGYKVDVQKLMGTLGVSVDVYRRGRHADYLSPYRPWTDEEIRLVGEKIRHFYGLFLNTVAEGRRSRGLTLARADEIGRGHVWTGAQALGLALVDRMGGVAAAIDDAAQRARVPLGPDGQPELMVLPRPSSNPLQRLLGVASRAAGATAGADDAELVTGGELLRAAGGGAVLRLLAPLLLGDGSGVEARLPYDLEIR